MMKKANENPPSTMEEGPLDHFTNPAPEPSNCQSHSSFLGVAAWRQRSRELEWKKRNFNTPKNVHVSQTFSFH
ncbi:hypothetical protein TNCT_238511 [Trichonephila clavata]|uniref:Uncharacterized protein n=1 Tax=Trichonephila clavata TaxID=2740835 RepID=A0A8X6LYE9_TRICU|nr:hypothetical protein TNCT_238511 [Trichonephila clavata]